MLIIFGMQSLENVNFKNIFLPTNRNYFMAILISLLFLLTQCHIVETRNSKLKEIKIVVNYPLVKERGELVNLPDTITIYYYKDFIICGLPYQSLSIKNMILIGEEKKYRLFFYRRNDRYGILYDSINNDIGYNRTKAEVDSILRNFVYQTDFSEVADSLTLFSSSRTKTSVVEKYSYAKTTDETSFDSIYFFYNKNLNSIDYSWSHKLDRARKMKLYKIRILFNAKFSKKYNVIMPQREFSYEILISKSTASKEIISFIENLARKYPNNIDN